MTSHILLYWLVRVPIQKNRPRVLLCMCKQLDNYSKLKLKARSTFLTGPYQQTIYPYNNQ